MKINRDDVRKVRMVQFGIMSPSEIRRMSVLEVLHPESLTEDKDFKKGGPLDLRLGSVERSRRCETCNCNSRECPGHFGHIELVRPVFHHGMMTTIISVLRCICFQCGRLLLEGDKKKLDRIVSKYDKEHRLRRLVQESVKIRECVGTTGDDLKGEIGGHSGCGSRQPKYLKSSGWIINAEFSEKDLQLDPSLKKKMELSAEKVLNLFKRISPKSCEVMGLSYEYARPEWSILTVLPVSPPQVRPSVKMDSVNFSYDDLTCKIGDIVKANNALKRHEEMGSPPHVMNEFVSLLQFHCATLFVNPILGEEMATQRGSKRPLKTIRSRLVGKEGRVRGNLMGKRVDFSARTVITPDPNISLTQVGIPQSIAENLTYPEIVTSYNKEKIYGLIKNGPTKYPGAAYVTRNDGRRIDLRYAKGEDLSLQVGYKVERQLIDGDFIIFNRQPSLHKMSMMGHRVKVMPYSTFRLNLAVTTPYNADFDGDEMNLHVPQSVETVAEVQELMFAPRQIISPQANKPVMSVVQDTMLGMNLLSKRDSFIEREEMMNLLLCIPSFNGQIPQPAILKPKKLWTGKQLISIILPIVNLIRFNSSHDEKGSERNLNLSYYDTKVVIDTGELLTGMLCKKTMGRSQGSIVHVIWMEHGSRIAANFLDSCQLLAVNFLLGQSFTIGIGDTVADESTMLSINRTISDAKSQVNDLILKRQQNELESEPGMTLQESFESKVNIALNRAVETAGKEAARSLADNNNLNTVVTAGSKGNTLNISQIIACVGQQNVEGKRIRNGFYGRTLPHFPRNDYGPEARGFVENSYLRGLTPQEFYFHAMGGREGLVDTAVKTSETGYIQRRLVKAMEDVMVKYDGTVRDSLGYIIQFIYGEDGMDGSMLENQKIPSFSVREDRLKKKYYLDPDSPDFGESWLTEERIEEIRNSEETRSALIEEYNKILEDREVLRRNVTMLKDSSWPLPCNIERLIWNSKRYFSVGDDDVTDLHPLDVCEKVKLLISRLDTGVRVEDKDIDPVYLFSVLLRATLASRRILSLHRLNSNAFSWLLGEIEDRFTDSLIQGGEMVGSLAAQSLGEPATQMTLNTFHFAGYSGKNVTLGVPRLKEIINCNENIKLPTNTIYLNKPSSQDKELAKEIQSDIAFTTVRVITEQSEIYYDPISEDTKNSTIEEDNDFVQTYYEMPDDDVQIGRLSPWLLRFVLSREQMIDRNLDMATVADTINAKFPGDLKCISSDDNAPKLVLRIRIIMNDEDIEFMKENTSSKQLKVLKLVEKEIMDMKLKGVSGISKVFMRKQNLSEVADDGSIQVNSEWVLDTEGANLQDILNLESIDYQRTTSNHIVEIFKVLGIEAVRNAILNEMRMVIKAHGIYVNYRHLALLADVMTQRGTLMSITRHGFNQRETGPLMRCSFEQTVEILFNAAAFSKPDYLKGVSENVLLGKLAPLGTGEFDVLLNAQMLEEEKPVPLDVLEGKGTSKFGELSPSQATPYAGAATPENMYTPMSTPAFDHGATFSPLQTTASIDTAGQYTPVDFSPGVDEPSPVYSPLSPGYSPSSPGYSPASPGYSPSSPAYSPSSPAYSPSSPAYSPSSPAYSPSSPAYSPSSPAYSPSSPAYSPSSPAYSPSSPTYSPSSPTYSPSSPTYSPSSPSYSPTSPAYSPSSPSYSPTSPAYSPTSPAYSPSSPTYSPNNEGSE